jgi:hypothetical protein
MWQLISVYLDLKAVLLSHAAVIGIWAGNGSESAHVFGMQLFCRRL